MVFKFSYPVLFAPLSNIILYRPSSTGRIQAQQGWLYTVSVLGRDKGYTVKYNPLLEGVPEGEARGNS